MKKVSTATSSSDHLDGSAVSLTDVSKTFVQGDTSIAALDKVTVAFTPGRFTSIMGPSGSGKTTLLYCAAGLSSIDSGAVHHGTQNLFNLSDRQRSKVRREEMGFVFQSYNLFADLTAERNITLTLQLAKHKVDRTWLDIVCDRLEIGDRLQHKPGQLSGGQQQRVAIARSLMTKPRVIFADEPTGALDSQSAAAVMQTLRMCVDDYGQTIVMVTHDQAAADYADHHVRMYDGRISSAPTESTTPDGGMN